MVKIAAVLAMVIGVMSVVVIGMVSVVVSVVVIGVVSVVAETGTCDAGLFQEDIYK